MSYRIVLMDSIPQALFLDRDGTLIEWVHFLSDPDEVKLTDGVSEALKRAERSGCRLFLHTNQSGVGRGYFGMDAVHACNRRMFELMGIADTFFDGICIAPDDPASVKAESYRKPCPWYELEQIEAHGLDPARCYMVGDRMSDVQTARNAGIRGVLIESEQSGSWQVPDGVERYDSLADFIESHFPKSETGRNRWNAMMRGPVQERRSGE